MEKPDLKEGPDRELRAVDRSGNARARLSVRGWCEAGHADRDADPADAGARLVRAVHRRGRGAWRDRPGSPRAPAHSTGSDPAGRRRVGDHHDRCDGDHAGEWWCRDGADPAGRRAPRGVRRLRPLAADDQTVVHAMSCSTILNPEMSGRRLRTTPRTAPASISLKASTRK